MRIAGYVGVIFPSKLKPDDKKISTSFTKPVVFELIIAFLSDWTEASYQVWKRSGKPIDF